MYEKSKEVADDLGISSSHISPSLWIEMKDYFDVQDYGDIRKSQMKDVLHFIMLWEPKKNFSRSDIVTLCDVPDV